MTANQGRAWPAAGTSLLKELQRPGRLVLIAGDRSDSIAVATVLAGLAGAELAFVTNAVFAEPTARTEPELVARLGDARFLADLECLFWRPWWQIDPIRFCRQLARRAGVVVVWPGRVADQVASFSTPGRRDYLSLPSSDVTVLRPVKTRFPDETPFTIERIPA